MENKRFGKNKERSFRGKGSRKNFGSSGFSSDEDNRKKGEERGSGKRFGSNRKSFSKDNRSDRDSFSKDRTSGRDSFSKDRKTGRDFSSREGGYKKNSFSGERRTERDSYSNEKRSDRGSFSDERRSSRNSYSQDKRGDRDFSKDKSSFRGRDEKDSRQRRDSGYSSERYNRNDRGERSFDKKDRYTDRKGGKDFRSSSDKNDRYTDRKGGKDFRSSSDKNDRYTDRRKDSEWSDRKDKLSVRRKDGEESSERKFKADRETLKKSHYSKKKQLEHRLKNPHQEDSFRLNRYIANSGVCSRREADKLIESGQITVNGNVVTEVGTKVKLTDVVKADGKALNPEKKVYVLLNKPKDFVTTVTDPMGRMTVMDLIKDACRERIFPVGRLDRMTSGLLLFTNDGDLAKKLTHPKYDKKKIYHAFLDKDLTKNDMVKIAEGLELEDGFIQADEISYVDNIKNQVGIEIHSGKNRIVRRIVEHLGYNVEKLDRVYFAGLTKKNLPRGRWRHLTEKEVTMLKSY